MSTTTNNATANVQAIAGSAQTRDGRQLASVADALITTYKGSLADLLQYGRTVCHYDLRTETKGEEPEQAIAFAAVVLSAVLYGTDDTTIADTLASLPVRSVADLKNQTADTLRSIICNVFPDKGKGSGLTKEQLATWLATGIKPLTKSQEKRNEAKALGSTVPLSKLTAKELDTHLADLKAGKDKGTAPVDSHPDLANKVKERYGKEVKGISSCSRRHLRDCLTTGIAPLSGTGLKTLDKRAKLAGLKSPHRYTRDQVEQFLARTAATVLSSLAGTDANQQTGTVLSAAA
jgi:hypothetical protein